MKPVCEVCRGSRQVRLSLHKPVSVRFSEFSPTAAIDDCWRSYPCPECGDVVPEMRLFLATEHSTLDSRVDDPGYRDAAQKQAAHALIAHLIKNDLVTFKWGPVDRDLRRRCDATVGVVSKTVVANLEQRIAARQEDVAREVADEAARKIRVRGSHYSGDEGNIAKSQAVAAVYEAMDAMVRKWRERTLST